MLAGPTPVDDSPWLFTQTVVVETRTTEFVLHRGVMGLQYQRPRIRENLPGKVDITNGP